MCSPQEEEEEEEGEKEKTHREGKCVRVCVRVARGWMAATEERRDCVKRGCEESAREERLWEERLGGRIGEIERARSNLRFILTYSYTHMSVSLSLWYYSTAVTRSTSIPACLNDGREERGSGKGPLQ